MNRTFFTDRDLGKKFPAILRAAGIVVESHGDHFAPDAPDDTWLLEVGRRGWIALTHDQRIRYKSNERDAVMLNGVGLIVVVGAAPYPDLARAFVASRHRVESFLDRNAPPFIAKLYRGSVDAALKSFEPGRVELWLSATDWGRR